MANIAHAATLQRHDGTLINNITGLRGFAQFVFGISDPNHPIRDMMHALRLNHQLRPMQIRAQAHHQVQDLEALINATAEDAASLQTWFEIIRQYLGFCQIQYLQGAPVIDNENNYAYADDGAGNTVVDLAWFCNQVAYLRYGYYMDHPESRPGRVPAGQAAGAPATSTVYTNLQKTFEPPGHVYTELQKKNPEDMSYSEVESSFKQASGSISFANQAWDSNGDTYCEWRPWAKQSATLNAQCKTVLTNFRTNFPYERWKIGDLGAPYDVVPPDTSITAYNNLMYETLRTNAGVAHAFNQLEDAQCFKGILEPDATTFKMSMYGLARLIPTFITKYEDGVEAAPDLQGALYRIGDLRVIDINPHGHPNPFRYVWDLITSSRVKSDKTVGEHYLNQLNSFVLKPGSIDLSSQSINHVFQKLLDLNGYIFKHHRDYALSNEALVNKAVELLRELKIDYGDISYTSLHNEPYVMEISKLNHEASQIETVLLPISTATRARSMTGVIRQATSLRDVMAHFLSLLDKFDKPTDESTYKIDRKVDPNDTSSPWRVKLHPDDHPHATAQVHHLDVGGQAAPLSQNDVGREQLHLTINKLYESGHITDQAASVLVSQVAARPTLHSQQVLMGNTQSRQKKALSNPSARPTARFRATGGGDKGSYFGGPGQGRPAPVDLSGRGHAARAASPTRSGLGPPLPYGQRQDMMARRAPALDRRPMPPPPPPGTKLYDPGLSNRGNSTRNPFRAADANRLIGKDALGQTRPPTPPAPTKRPWDTKRLRDLGDGVKDVLSKAQESGDPLKLTPHLRKRLIGIGTSLQNAVLFVDAGRESEAEFTMEDIEYEVMMIDSEMAIHCNYHNLEPPTPIAEHVHPDSTFNFKLDVGDGDFRRGGEELDEEGSFINYSDGNFTDDDSHADFELDQVSARS